MGKKRKLLAVASAGGHWTQLNLINDAFSEFDIHYVTTNLNHNIDDNNRACSTVVDADRTQKLKMLLLCVQMVWIVIRHRPHTVISTGAAPGLFAIIFGRLIGDKTVWVDSMANYQALSGSGLKARRFCHLFLTQWPHLSTNEDIKYQGSLL